MEPWEVAAWFSWVIPLIGALLMPLLSKLGEKLRDYIAPLFTLSSALLTTTLIPLLFGETKWPLQSKVEWLVAPGMPLLSKLEASVLVDPLSIILSNVVAWISFLIMVYSIEYMHGEEGLTRYWFFMNLFVGNMLLLVFSGNIVQMLFGWEGVGLCSYALIGFWYRDSKEDWLKCWVGEPPEAYPPSHCGLKAFLVTRLGDTLMLAGAFIVLALTGTLDFIELVERAGAVESSAGWLVGLALVLMLMGAAGKSAQLPFTEWLPDAMAGPTTVSALIHAATMVKAGVFLVARLLPIAAVWSVHVPEASLFFAVALWIGTATAFLAGIQGAVATELKKALAYSTLSQLGYMMMALGAAGFGSLALGYAAGIFHLVSHAVFKAALFLTAGAVLHETGSRFFRDLGGLRSKMPITFWATVLAACSLMGLPFLFSGFWSKDLILEVTLVAGQHVAFALGVLTALVTAFYTVRLIGLTFLGRPSEYLKRREREGHHVHEVGPIMWVPFTTLAAVTVVLGVLGPLAKSWFEETAYVYLHELVSHYAEGSHAAHGLLVPVLATTATLVGLSLSSALYVRRVGAVDQVARTGLVEALRKFLLRRLYLNAAYYKIAEGTRCLANALFRIIEAGLYPSTYRAIYRSALGAYDMLKRLHTGKLRYNVIGYLIGLLLIVAIFVLVGGW